VREAASQWGDSVRPAGVCSAELETFGRHTCKTNRTLDAAGVSKVCKDLVKVEMREELRSEVAAL